MANVIFYRSTARLARAGELLGHVRPIYVALAVRAFGLDLVVHAGPLRVAVRSAFAGAVVFEYLLPELPPPLVRPTFEAKRGLDPTVYAVIALVCASAAKVPTFRALNRDRADASHLLSACSRDNLTRVL